MAKQQISTKRTAISKANTQMVIIVAIASFVTVFSLVASKTVLAQNAYQNKVIAKKAIANKQLGKNVDAVKMLTGSYQDFIGSETNVIGGNPSGTGDRDGDNAKIVLDALPSTYDFPALTSSIEKIIADQNLKVSTITGIDDQLNQESNVSSPNPEAVPIPFGFSVSGASYASVQNLINAMEHSIRPITVDTLTLSGGTTNMTATITAHTYYQPAKNLKITSEAVK